MKRRINDVSRGMVLTAGLALAMAAPALAQTSTYRSKTVVPGKAVRIGVVTSLKKDCTVGPTAEVKVLTPPKHGTLSVKRGKLKTPASYRCPNVETPVQALFYQANPKYTGPDEIKYEARSPDQAPQEITVQVDVTDKPAPARKDEGATEL